MVSFRAILTSALALSVPIAAQITPAQVVQNIQMITQKSQALQGPSQSINLINGPLVLVGQGPFPQIITGFVDIVSTATTAIAQMQGMAPVPAGPDADKIFESFREVRFSKLRSQTLLMFQKFVRVHQALLNILIGKAGLFQTVPFIGQPVASVLRQVENVVDTIAFSLIDMVQSRATDIQSSANSLGMTLDTTIKSYEGISTTKKRSLRSARREVVIVA